MDAARREKKEHGTQSFPFQIYPALDGSEADDSDFIPYHWHPELEIITVDAGRVSLTIADHIYEGVHGHYHLFEIFHLQSFLLCENLVFVVKRCYDNRLITRSLLRYNVRSIETDPMDV